MNTFVNKFAFRKSAGQDLPRVMEIWRNAVDATHDFLAPADRAAIEAELLALDAAGMAQGFMFLHEGHLEALFIEPDHHGRGMGKAFVQQAVAAYPDLSVDVNEQNPQALAFYEHVGFVPIGRSTHDGQGRPYPLIHLRYRGVCAAPQ